MYARLYVRMHACMYERVYMYACVCVSAGARARDTDTVEPVVSCCRIYQYSSKLYIRRKNTRRLIMCELNSCLHVGDVSVLELSAYSISSTLCITLPLRCK
jgi:hypothetical protein